MSRLFKNKSMGVQVWDMRAMINVRNLFPCFHKGSQLAIYKCNSQNRFDPIKEPACIRDVCARDVYKILENFIATLEVCPKKGDIIELNIINNNLVDSYSQIYDSDKLGVMCVHSENVQSLIRFDNDQTFCHELSPGLLFVVDSDITDVTRTSGLSGPRGVEYLLGISYIS